MLDAEEIFIIDHEPLHNNYCFSSHVNIIYHDSVDFFIYIKDNTNISSIYIIIEYSAKKEPLSTDWARVQIETFDSNEKVYNLVDYIVKKEISQPTVYSIRCRGQGKLMRLGIKANADGGIVSIGAIRKNRK